MYLKTRRHEDLEALGTGVVESSREMVNEGRGYDFNG